VGFLEVVWATISTVNDNKTDKRGKFILNSLDVFHISSFHSFYLCFRARFYDE
jgi:hypothetical protein